MAEREQVTSDEIEEMAKEIGREASKLSYSANEGQSSRMSSGISSGSESLSEDTSHFASIDIEAREQTKMGSCMHQFRVVLWKNSIIRRRHLFALVFEILTPTAIFLILAIANAKRDTFSETLKEQHSPREDITTKFPANAPVIFLYSPKTNFVKQLMDKVSLALNIPKSEYIGLNSQKEVQTHRLAIHRNDSKINIMAVIFEEASPATSSNKFLYKIMYELVDPVTLKTKTLYLVTDRYITSGFATLQYALDKSYIELKGKKDIKSEFYIQKFPRPETGDATSGRAIILSQLTILTAFGFLTLQFLVPRIVEEKYSGIKELMKLMGLRKGVMWLGWFINALIPPFISIIIVVILLKVTLMKDTHPVLECSPVVLFLHLLLYCIASIIFLFAISALCQHPLLAAAVSFILSYGSLIILNQMKQAKRWHWSLILLSMGFPNIPLFYGYDIIKAYEHNGMVFGMNNLASYNKIPRQQKIVMFELWIMFLVEMILYSILTLYFEAVLPGRYGIPQPWNFLCTKSYWKKPNQVADDGEDSVEENKNYEKVNPARFTPGIEIFRLKKKFRSMFGHTKLAVAGITLNIYEDQITVLLGHNGAGKTTTLFMLTGMYYPTSGYIKMAGYDIQHDITAVRQNLGLCPQQNMLHSDLTVEEHLVFFSMVKGASKKEARDEARELVSTLKLKGHEKDRPSHLSGGMKRRLNLGISLCGNPKVVILDEPTSGLDPELRREIWDLLLEMRGQRTILITTHDMEEADVLGDFIAIMDHGRVKCYGTPMFLKNIFGTGYHLEIVKDAPNRDTTIIQLVRSVIPQAVVKTQLPTLIVFNLPSKGKSNFPKLFTLLEEKRTSAGIINIGISLTTMEEVFLKVGEGEHGEKNPRKQRDPSRMINIGDDYDSEEPPGMCAVRFLMMFYKTIMFTQRNYLLVIGLALVPVIMTVVSILTTGAEARGRDNDPIELKLNALGETKVLYETDPGSALLAHYYEKTIKRFEGSVEAVKSVIEALMSIAKEDYYQYIMHYIVAADFKASKNSITALHSGTRDIGVPVSINLVTNALLKEHTSSESSEIGIKSQPFEGSKDEDEIAGEYWTSVASFHIFWLAHFISLPLIERVTEIKHLQLMTGVAPITYWSAMYLWDVLLSLCVNVLIIVAAAVVDYNQRYTGVPELIFAFCMFTSYLFSALPLIYLMSYTTNTFASCYALTVISFYLAFVLKLMFIVFQLFIEKDIVDSLTYAASIIPYYALIETSMVFTQHVDSNNMCKKMSEEQIKMTCIMDPKHKCCACTDDECAESRTPYFQVSGKENDLFRLVLTMLLSTFLYFALLLLIDSRVIDNFTACIVRRYSKDEDEDETEVDSDVLDEEKKIERVFREKGFGGNYENILLVWKLRKKYNFTRTAVQTVSFRVTPGECFGLLGVNGAGKSTTFKMLTGTVARTHGDAAILKWVLSQNKSKFLAQIGYCPQTDAIISCITPWEHIVFFSRLRGLTKEEARTEAEKWIDQLDLQEYENKHAGTLSGGNRRKTCTGIALAGTPFLVMLDEPTSGVDPVSRRSLWSVLENVQRKGQSLVLTSHSMDECEAMCDRLAIMVSGRFQCLGNIHHLKKKFAQGYTVKIKLNMEEYSVQNVQKIKNDIRMLKEAKAFFLKDEHMTMLHYHVTDPKISWSNIFKILEDLKAKHATIDDYSIGQTTLEEIFLSFAKNQ